MISIHFSILLVSTLALAKADVYPNIVYPIVDTGVTTYYGDFQEMSTTPSVGDDFYGQDATYSGNQPSYTFDDVDETVVYDQVTGLYWQRYISTQGRMNWTAAQSLVSTLSLGGYSDWRIPTVKELYSLILFTGTTAGEAAGDERFIDTDYFEQPIGDTSEGFREIDAQTLSDTAYTGQVFGDQDCNFGVNFVDGRIKCYRPDIPNWYFRFVRGNTEYGTNSFKRNGDGTITDENTGLMWMNADSGTYNWKSALAYCEDLTRSGYSDWRLPNIKELQSLVDYTAGPQTTGTPAIDSKFTVSSITLEDGTVDYPYFWSGTTHYDASARYGAYIAFGQGWGKDNDEITDVHGAGCQRGDPKSEATGESFPDYFGPQDDLRQVYNYVRCVRDA